MNFYYEKLNKILPHIFITNNIEASLHNKINDYLKIKNLLIINLLLFLEI